MFCKKVNKVSGLLAEDGTIICESYDIDDVFAYMEIPDGMDIDCVSTHLVDGIVTFYVDSVKTKYKAIAQLNAQTWETILNQASTVYEIDRTNKSRDEMAILILSTHSTYAAMVANPAQYVLEGVFADEATVLAYAEPKLASSNAFGLWRIGVLAQEAVQKAVIEAG